MSNIIDKQTFVISVNLATLTGAIPSQVTLPMTLTFVADDMILKSLIYHNTAVLVNADIDDIVQVWCNLPNDKIICAFPNAPNPVAVALQLDQAFRLSNRFQSGNFVLQFPQTALGAPASYNPQALISTQAPQRTFGTVVLTIEFVKYAK